MSDPVTISRPATPAVAVGDRAGPVILLSKGSQGERGPTPYEAAVEAGFAGSEEDWFASLVGPQGPEAELNSVSATMTADIPLLVSLTWYDGPAVELTAGRWLVMAHVTFIRSATTETRWVARISDGQNHYASGQASHISNNGHAVQISMSAVVTVEQTTVVKLQGSCNAGAAAALMKAATSQSSSGNNATMISAIRIG